MPYFRKKPLVVHAELLTTRVTVETLHGPTTGEPGDWLITGPDGDQWPCRADIFEKFYEPA